jgi:hypothetical protein
MPFAATCAAVAAALTGVSVLMGLGRFTGRMFEHEIDDRLDPRSKSGAGLHREMLGNGAKDDGREEREAAHEQDNRGEQADERPAAGR